MMDVEERVRLFVAEETGRSAEDITAETTLLGDLGIDGDDARDFLATFTERCGVDLSTFEYDRHFGPEGIWPWFPIRWLIHAARRGTPEEKAGLKPLTVADLVRSSKAGRWV